MAVAPIAPRPVAKSCMCVSAVSTSSIGSFLFRDNSHFFCNKSRYASSLLSQQLLYSSSSSNSIQSLKKPIYSENIVVGPDFFIEKYNLCPELASRVASASVRMRNPRNPDLVLSFLVENGFSNSQLQRIVRHCPDLLSHCPEKIIRPKFKIFKELGFSVSEVAEVVALHLDIMSRGENMIISSLSVLQRVLGSNDRVVLLLKKSRSAGLFYTDLQQTLLPNIEYLKSCGVQVEQINSFIYARTAFFLLSPENMRRCVQKVDEMGFDRTSNAFVYAVWVVSSMSEASWELKMRTFRDLGFTEDDILRVFRSSPMVVAVSVPKMKKVTEALLETGKYDMSCIVRCPASLTCSVEKRYKPQLHVLKVLEKRGLIEKWPTLSALSKKSSNIFFKKFVAPYINEFREDFIVKAAFGAHEETGVLL